MPKDQTKFWMVYGIGQREPRYRHWTKEAAQNEALRLAGQHHGVTFVVLAAVDAFQSDIPPVAQLPVVKRPPLEDDIPF